MRYIFFYTLAVHFARALYYQAPGPIPSERYFRKRISVFAFIRLKHYFISVTRKYFNLFCLLA